MGSRDWWSEWQCPACRQWWQGCTECPQCSEEQARAAERAQLRALLRPHEETMRRLAASDDEGDQG